MTATKEGHLRYFVTSDTKGDNIPPYLVDLMEWRCDCDDFRIRVLARKEKDECKHLAFACEVFGREMLREIKETMQKK